VLYLQPQTKVNNLNIPNNLVYLFWGNGIDIGFGSALRREIAKYLLLPMNAFAKGVLFLVPVKITGTNLGELLKYAYLI
jgi:hypothetical protein